MLQGEKKAVQSYKELEANIKQKDDQQVEIAALEAKIEYLNRELTTREERGTLIHSTHIRHQESASHRSYANLFGRFFAGATSLTIREPYIEASHQLTNLSEFLEMAIQTSGGPLTRAILYTQDFARTQRTGLPSLVDTAAAPGRFLEVRYEPRLHHRSIELSTGIVIMSDRGLDMYEAPPRGLRRRAAGRAARLFFV